MVVTRTTALERRVEKVSYRLGYLFFPMLILTGFGIIPWLYFLYYFLLFPLSWLILVVTGWKKYSHERLAQSFAEYGINTEEE